MAFLHNVFFKPISKITAKTGKLIGLPEMGISERIASLKAPKAMAFNAPYGLQPTPQQQQTIMGVSTQAQNEPRIDFTKQAYLDFQAGRPDPSLANNSVYMNTYNRLLQTTANQSQGGSGNGSEAIIPTQTSTFVPTPEPVYTPDWQQFNNKYYDFNNPDDRVRFFKDKMTELERLRDEEINKSKTGYNQQIALIDQNIVDTENEAKKYVEDYKKQVNAFGQDYQLGNVKRQQAFAGLSPNAFQSSQGTSQEFANQQYLTGMGELAKGAQETVGADYLGGGQLGENTVYGKDIATAKQERNTMANAFNDYLNQLNQDIQSQANTVGNELKFTPQFNAGSYTPTSPTVNKVNTAQYEPYTQFQNSSGGVSPILPNTAQKVIGINAFNEQTPVLPFLGQNQINQKDTNWLRKYLLGQTA